MTYHRIFQYPPFAFYSRQVADPGAGEAKAGTLVPGWALVGRDDLFL